MGFNESAKAENFRTGTEGDHMLAEVVSIESNDKGTEYLLLKSYDASDVRDVIDPKTGYPKLAPKKKPDGSPELDAENKPVMVPVKAPAERMFTFYDLNTTRDYKRRAARAKANVKGDMAACKYVRIVCTGENAKGFGEFKVAFSNDKADMTKELARFGGVYFNFTLKELPPREGGGSGGASASAPAAPGGDDNDMPF